MQPVEEGPVASPLKLSMIEQPELHGQLGDRSPPLGEVEIAVLYACSVGKVPLCNKSER